MGFDFSFYIHVFRKWLWLIIFFSLIAGIAVFFVLNQRQNVYEARTLINVGSYLYSANPDFNDLRIGQELTETYAYLAGTDSIHEASARQLNGQVSAEDIDDSVSTNLILNTSLFEVIVTYPDPIIATDIANAVSEQLVLQSPSNLTPQLQNQVTLSQTQITLLNEQLADLQVQSDAINASIDEAQAEGDQETVDILLEQRSRIIQQINQATATIANFSNNITEIEQRANSISIQEFASVPSSPASRNTVLLLAIAVLATGVFVSGAVIFFEALNPTVYTENHLQNQFNLPVSGRVSVGKQSARTLEAYHKLRTNLLYRTDKPATYIFTAPSEAENRVDVIKNLLRASAESGLSTLVIDADLRNPQLHNVLSRTNTSGLIDLLQGFSAKTEDTQSRQNMLGNVIQSTKMERTYFIAGGKPVENSVRLLESKSMTYLLKMLSHMNKFDLIIMNTPPISTYTDTVALAAHTLKPVVLHAEYGKTQSADVISALAQLEKVNATVAGAVFIKS